MEVVVLNCCVTATNETCWASEISTIFVKSGSERVRRQRDAVEAEVYAAVIVIEI